MAATTHAAALDDPQRDTLYEAEDRALGDGRRFARFAEVERFVADVVADTWWLDDLGERWSTVTPERVVVARRSRSATASVAEVDRPVVHLRDGHWTAAVVLHELAHLVARDAEPHGPLFCGVLCDLVRRHMGFHAAVALRSELEAAGVRIAAPREVA